MAQLARVGKMNKNGVVRSLAELCRGRVNNDIALQTGK